MAPTDQLLCGNIRQLCAEGYQCYDGGDYKAALRLFYQAWLLLPKPQTEWVEAGWVLTAIGDAYFRSAQYQPGAEALQSALCCSEMSAVPFIHLRLGQCLWELEQGGQAQGPLLRAYQIAGADIFAAEDRKYYFAIAELILRQHVPDVHSPADDGSIQQPHHKRFQALGD